MTSKTPAMLLQELSMKKIGRGPSYQLITQEQGTHENLFEYIVDVLGVTASGRGRSKKEAKQETAKNALLMLNEQYDMDYVPPNIAQSSQQQQSSPDGDGELRKVVNYIGDLDDICAINNLPEVQYELIFDSGPPHQKIFTFEGKVGQSIVERSTASTKKLARHNVAKQILERLQGIVPPLYSKALSLDQLEICDKDQEILDHYMELKFLKKPPLNLKICDYHLHLRQYLEEKCVPIEDIAEHMKPPYTEKELQILLERLDLEIHITDMTEEGSKDKIVAYTVNTCVPICTMAVDCTIEGAKQKALEGIFQHFRVLTGIST